MVRLLLILGLVLNLFACASSPEEESPPPTPPVAESPPPPPEPAPVYEPEPVRELPRTGSSLPALGLSGLAALAGAGVLHVVRSRIR
jgi:LPXTG-motif cell wall-anchored protein